MEKNYGNKQKPLKIFNNFIASELIYHGKSMYFGKNYDTLLKTMELWFTIKKTYGTMDY